MKKKKKSSGTNVKVGRTGGKVEEYNIEGDEPTVGEALEEAGISVSKGDRIRMDGELVDQETILEEGAIIMVSGKVSGGK